MQSLLVPSHSCFLFVFLSASAFLSLFLKILSRSHMGVCHKKWISDILTQCHSHCKADSNHCPVRKKMRCLSTAPGFN